MSMDQNLLELFCARTKWPKLDLFSNFQLPKNHFLRDFRCPEALMVKVERCHFENWKIQEDEEN